MGKGDQCAREVLDVVPSVMRFIRTEMRKHRGLDLSVPQFRSLVFIERTEGASLTAVSEHLGLTPPSTCKLVDGLVSRGMVTRNESQEDRRRLLLAITAAGAAALGDARKDSLASLSGLLGSLDSQELSQILGAMSALRRIFASDALLQSGGRSGTNGNSRS
jgi:DNA-binding MarR family transcriptional regulator